MLAVILVCAFGLALGGPVPELRTSVVTTVTPVSCDLRSVTRVTRVTRWWRVTVAGFE